MIEVKNIPNKKRGIIAIQDILKGQLIEVAPVVAFPLQKIPNIHETEIFKYYFVRPTEYGQSQNMKGYLVFGLVSLCNHAEKPNSRVDWVEDEVGLWSNLIAETDIQVGEEITMFYANIDEYSDANKFV